MEEVSVVVDPAALHVAHHRVPGDGDRVPEVVAGVGEVETLLQPSPDPGISLESVHHTHHYPTDLVDDDHEYDDDQDDDHKNDNDDDHEDQGLYLENKYDDEKETIRSQKNSALLQWSTVTKEGNDEDEASNGNENVGSVIQNWGIWELVNNILGIVIGSDDCI